MKIELLNVRIFIQRIRWSPMPSETTGMSGSLSIPVMRPSAARPERTDGCRDGGG